MGTILTEFRLMKVLLDYTSSGDESHLKCKLADPAFSDFEDPDYRAFFNRAVPIIDRFASGDLAAAEAARNVFDLTNDYEFPVYLSVEAMKRAGWLGEGETISDRSVAFARSGYRWALSNPSSRDLYGTSETLYRWRARRSDPHLNDEDVRADG
jgi:FADH2 O2-dependent halogenase